MRPTPPRIRTRTVSTRRATTNGIYKAKLWEMRRRQVITEQPICNICDQRLAVEIDHITPLDHDGAPYDRDNLQGLCVDCHRTKTAAETGEG